MASAEGDLTDDSVPDPPRIEVTQDDSRRNSNNDTNNNSDSDGNGAEGSAKERESGERSSSSHEKKRRPSNSNPKPKSPFSIPQMNAPGAANMICISNSNHIHVGNTVSINFVGQTYTQPRGSKSPSPEPRNTEKPKGVKDACMSTAVVSENDIDAVTVHVGKRWTKLGERLGYSEEQMERFHEDHQDIGLKEVVYQMLLDWKQYKGPDAQVGILCRCLWSSRLYTAAEQLAANHSGKSL